MSIKSGYLNDLFSFHGLEREYVLYISTQFSSKEKILTRDASKPHRNGIEKGNKRNAIAASSKHRAPSRCR
jgi:hypothetical protein